MQIKFTEPRELVGAGIVAADEVRDFPEAEAEAYIANGVAVAVSSTPATGKTKKEVTDNG
jgi:hypothetical protein